MNMLLEQSPQPKTLKLAIFWDYENVSFNSTNLIQFLKNIPLVERNICKKYNGSNDPFTCISLKRVFADWTKIAQETQSYIRDAGFELIQVPNTGRNSSDNGLMRNAREIIKFIQPHAFLLISVDGDYINLLNEQKEAGIFTAFIGREHSVSRDLKGVVDLYYFVEKEGTIFEYTKITKESAVQIIENALSDAYTALKNLEKESKVESQCIFQFSQWRDAFARLENFKNPDLGLYQILGLKDLFKIMAQRYGLAHSLDYEWVCSRPFFKEKNIQEIMIENPEYSVNETKEVISSLLPLEEKEIAKIFKEFACPSQNASRTVQKKIEKEQTQKSMEKAEEIKRPNSSMESIDQKSKQITPTSNKIIKKAVSEESTEEKMKYLQQLADIILEFFNLERIAKTNRLAISSIEGAYKKRINGQISIDGSEHYKRFGYSKFSKAVGDALSLLNEKSGLNKKFAMEKSSTQNFVKCI